MFSVGKHFCFFGKYPLKSGFDGGPQTAENVGWRRNLPINKNDSRYFTCFDMLVFRNTWNVFCEKTKVLSYKTKGRRWRDLAPSSGDGGIRPPTSLRSQASSSAPCTVAFGPLTIRKSTGLSHGRSCPNGSESHNILSK